MEIGPIFRALLRNKVRFVLIVAEVALTFAIVANCVGLITDARDEMARPSGFDDENLIYVASTPFSEAFRQEEYVEAGVDVDVATLAAIPGVRAVSHTTFLPWAGGGSSFEVVVDGREMEKVRSQFYFADPQIFDTLGIEILEGRGLNADDYAYEPPEDAEVELYSTVISKALADLLFPDGNALGQNLRGSRPKDLYRIVGIADPFYNPYGWPIHEYVAFFASRSASFGGGSKYLVRTQPGRLQQVAGDMEEALLAADDGRNLFVRTLPEMRERYHAQDAVLVRSLNAMMFLLVGVTALGIVGLTSFSVTERRRQIGTRRAMGATRMDIVRFFLTENFLVTSLGVALGVALAYGLNFALVTLVTGPRLDAPVILAGAVLLWLLGLAAAAGPALRGARIAPAVATRNV